MMVILNAFFVVLFWNMSDIAKEENRPGWAFIYLIASAANGAAVLASIF
jgi:hypothetical protein